MSVYQRGALAQGGISGEDTRTYSGRPRNTIKRSKVLWARLPPLVTREGVSSQPLRLIEAQSLFPISPI